MLFDVKRVRNVYHLLIFLFSMLDDDDDLIDITRHQPDQKIVTHKADTSLGKVRKEVGETE